MGRGTWAGLLRCGFWSWSLEVDLFKVQSIDKKRLSSGSSVHSNCCWVDFCDQRCTLVDEIDSHVVAVAVRMLETELTGSAKGTDDVASPPRVQEDGENEKYHSQTNLGTCAAVPIDFSHGRYPSR
ncbi:hypothetical protein S83_057323, partial [Arachis hypogaea]